MARFKATLAFGGVKEDVSIAAYTTGNATANVEINVDSAVVTDKGDLAIMLEHMANAIRDSEAGYPPA